MRVSTLVLAALPMLAASGAAGAHGSETHVDAGTLAAASGLLLSATIYAAAVARGASLRRRHVAAFGSGWLTIALALLSPLDAAASGDFSLHMVQHELLMIVAPPLLILGRPFTALAAVLPRPAVAVAAWPLRLPPVAAWLLHAAALWIWHAPALFDAAVAIDAVHALQHASFFGTALLFWWAVLRRVRNGVAVVYLLTTLIHSGALAALLTFAPVSVYADTTLAQQQLGGLVMWVPAGYALLGAGLVVFNRLLAADG